MIAGDWMYRSYLNNPDPVGDDPQKAVGNIFGEGVFSLATSTKDSVTGTFDMGGGLVLDLRGQISARSRRSPQIALPSPLGHRSENLRCRVTDAGGYPKALAVIDGATADRAAGGALGRSIKICSEGRQNHGKRVYVSGS
jgi:hypothetical protein